MRNQISPFTITAGSIIPITMLTGINSDLPGDIVAQVNRNVYDSVTGNYLLIPAGAKAVGRYDSGVTWGQKRVLVIWSRLVFPDGSSIDLRGMQGIDLDGMSGYNDQIDAHIPELIALALTSTVLNIGTGQLSTLAGGQSNAYMESLIDSLASGADGTADMIEELSQKIINLQPTLKIRKGKRVEIFISRDLILQPYERTI